MAVASRGRAELPRHWRERDATSPERTKVWTEPHRTERRKVPVVYYLSRNGNLEHPHFMEVSLSSPDGLYLRDVINRLNTLRGKGLAFMYSWSSKRCYKNGYVWHDLTEDDFIYPSHGKEYVLKGSELLQLPSPISRDDTAVSASASSSSSSDTREVPRPTREDASCPRQKKPQWGSFDLAEHKADAATQTDDRRPWRRPAAAGGGGDLSEVPNPEEDDATTELGRGDVSSPPPPSSSPETLEALIKSDGRPPSNVAEAAAVAERVAAGGGASGLCASGRARASAVLINFISCGAISVKDRDDRLVVMPRCRPAGLPAGGNLAREREVASKEAEEGHVFRPVRLEDKEYFSGSLIETKKNGSDSAGEFATLKRSNSYNADRFSNLDLAEGEVDGAKAKCIPRKPKLAYAKKECGPAAISRSSHGSKRITSAEVPK